MLSMARCKTHGICKHETMTVCSLCAAENSGTHPTSTISRVMPCPAFVKGEHCIVLPVAMCPDEPCELSRARP